MNANEERAWGIGGAFGDLSQRVIGCALAVSNALGTGFLESVYENAFAVELGSNRIPFERQKGPIVRYRALDVGHFYADLIVDRRLLVELKALRQLTAEHEAQVMNYLRATGLRVGLLLNFGTQRLGIRRVVWGYEDDSKI